MLNRRGREKKEIMNELKEEHAKISYFRVYTFSDVERITLYITCWMTMLIVDWSVGLEVKRDKYL